MDRSGKAGIKHHIFCVRFVSAAPQPLWRTETKDLAFSPLKFYFLCNKDLTHEHISIN